MGDVGYDTQIHLQEVDPYSRAFLPDGINPYYTSVRCPNCGSEHKTIFPKVIKRNNERKIYSGELSFLVVEMASCLNCSTLYPVSFRHVREA